MNLELLSKWQKLKDRQDELESELELIGKALAEMNDDVLKEFTNGVTRVVVNGRAISVRREVRPSPKIGRAELVEALKANGYGEFVKEDYNAQKLYSLTCEMIRNYEADLSDEGRVLFVPDDAIPEGLKPYLKLHEIYKVTQRK